MEYKTSIKERERARAWAVNNPDKAREYKRKWDRSEKGKATKKQWRASSPKQKEIDRRSRARITDFTQGIKEAMQCQNPFCPCAGRLPSYCLDYHHLSEKAFNLGTAGKRSLSSVLGEINKCTVLCAVCHRMERWGELDASKFPLCNV